jgi:hypothetical protein
MHKALVTDWIEFEQLALDLLDAFILSDNILPDDKSELTQEQIERLYKEFEEYVEEFFDAYLDSEKVESIIILGDRSCEEIYREETFKTYIFEALGIKNREDFAKLLKDY